MHNPQELAFLHSGLLAYLDGGSGSMVFQIALSGLLATAYVTRAAWSGVISKFKKIGRKG
jgi:hypothetical protein